MMRIATLKMEGKVYPLIFSLNAAEKIEDECIQIDDMMDCFINPKKYSKNGVRIIKDILFIMLCEGIRYCQRKEIKEYHSNKLELEIPDKKELFQDTSYDDFGMLIDAVYNALITSKKKESTTKSEKETKEQ